MSDKWILSDRRGNYVMRVIDLRPGMQQLEMTTDRGRAHHFEKNETFDITRVKTGLYFDPAEDA
jgi:hypothetical protein